MFLNVDSLVTTLVVTSGYKFIFFIFLLNVNFDKFIIELYFLLIPSMLGKFSKNQKSIILSSIKYVNFSSFYYLKSCVKNKFINQIVNNIIRTQNMTYVLKIKRIFNPMIKFSKFVVMLIFFCNL